MSQTILTLNRRLPQPIDASTLLPSRLSALNAGEIERESLQVGNRQLPLGELFKVEVSPSETERLIFRGETQGLDFIGRGLTEGHIEVEGSAGSYLGHQMRGGRLRVQGSIDAYGACELRGGFLEVLGDAGDFLGGALPGNGKGMSGGVVLVRGDAGDRAGDHLRRGVLLIEGRVGAYSGARMKAGSILVQGAVGPYPGYAMGRGTLMLARAPETLLPTFRDCGTHTLGFIPLLLNSLRGYDTVFSQMAPVFRRVRRHAGDFAALGKGEILYPV